jgi:putative chitinase
MISTRQLRAIMPTLSEDAAAAWISPLNDAMVAFGIDQNLRRQAAFLAQCAHESGELRYVREIASGEAYQGRRDLGNTEQLDGRWFAGRGLLQITGRNNYASCSLALYGDERLLTSPYLLEDPWGAAQASAWFWQAHGLNLLADAEKFESITRIINGGLNGQDQRLIYYARARSALGLVGALTS